MAEQLVSNDPNWTVTPPSASGPRMSASTAPVVIGGREYGRALPADAQNPDEHVTLQDIQENPREAFAKIGTFIKRDLSDPKTWLMAAAQYFGPKAMEAMLPTARAAAAESAAVSSQPSVMRRVAGAVEPGDVGILSPRLGKALELAQRLKAAMTGSTSPAEAAPVAPAPPGPPPPVAAAPTPAPTAAGAPPVRPVPPPPVGAPQTPPPPATVVRPATAENYPQKFLNEIAIQGRRQKVDLSDADYAHAFALTQRGASPADAVAAVKSAAPSPKADVRAAEFPVFQKLLMQGKTPAEAYRTVVAMRQLGAGLPSNADVAKAVTDRNATGRWPQGTP